MKDKIMLDVLLPATQRSYEFRVPFDLTVDQAAQLMARILATREPASYEADGNADLMLRRVGPDGRSAGMSDGEMLNPNETFRALAERNVLVDGSPVAIV